MFFFSTKLFHVVSLSSFEYDLFACLLSFLKLHALFDFVAAILEPNFDLIGLKPEPFGDHVALARRHILLLLEHLLQLVDLTLREEDARAFGLFASRLGLLNAYVELLLMWQLMLLLISSTPFEHVRALTKGGDLRLIANYRNLSAFRAHGAFGCYEIVFADSEVRVLLSKSMAGWQ